MYGGARTPPTMPPNLDAGQAGLLVVGASTLGAALETVELKAEKHVAKELNVSTKDIDAAVVEAAGEVV